ncbi:MAG: FAD-binding oxidoreductase [Chloroflexota bacterium]|nr:MAG: FAD-binding oxidoreductase [Chloroflexota bacterium]
MAVAIRKAHHPLYYDLAGIVGPASVSDDDFTLETYSRDTSPLPPNKQGIVVRPVNTDQVVDIVKLANVTKIPIVPSGGRASFYGTPKGLHGKGIVVDMTRMNKMLKVDEANLTATAEAGMTTAEFNTRLWDMGWDVHTAYMPWYPDTLGGQLAGFAGGGNGMEMASAGFNATHIAGVKVVLPDASVVQTGSGAGSNIHNTMVYDRYPGNPDLTGIFVGDAGTFGIKVEATYRLYKLAPHKVAGAHLFDSFEQAWDLFKEMSILEPLPYYHMVIIPPTESTKVHGATVKGIGVDKFIVMWCAKGNSEKEMNAKVEIIDEVMAKHNGVRGTGPAVEEWVQGTLTGRRVREMGAFGSMGTWTFFEYFVSRSQVLDCRNGTREFIYRRLKENGITYQSHEGCIPSGANTWIITTIIFLRGEDKRAQQVVGELFADATEFACSHGWYPDCHQGWGTRMMAKNWPKHHYEFMRKLKGAFDPNNIMNPGVWDL